MAIAASAMPVTGAYPVVVPRDLGALGGGAQPVMEAAAAAQALPITGVRVGATRAGGHDSQEQRVLDLVNNIRRQHGLRALSFDQALSDVARGHAAQMGAAGVMAHSGIGDGTPGERIRARGIFGSWGENVAAGQTSAEQVVNEWMNSPTHRANILDARFSSLSVARTTGADGRQYWAQEFRG